VTKALYMLHVRYLLHMRCCGDAVQLDLPGARAREALAWASNPRTYPPSVVPGYAPSVVLGYVGKRVWNTRPAAAKGFVQFA
jgi:hypothetical protein